MLRASPLLAAHGFAHGFSTREGGLSAPPFDTLNLARNVGDDPASVAANHARFARAVGYAPERLAEVTQVHGARTLDVDAFVGEGALDVERVRAEEADAIASARAGIAVAVRTADCLPLLLADPRTGVVAAVHAGWRGAAAGIATAAIEHLARAHRARPSTLVAAIGPHIRAASFEVGDEVVDAFERALEAVSSPHARRAAIAREGALVKRVGARPHASLAALVVAQLLGAGLSLDRIDDVGGDTFAEAARFHSYRRDGARSGRQLSVIVAR